MKKLIGILTCASVLLCSFSCFAQSTAQTVYNYTKDGNQYFTTSGVIENGANKFVTLLVTDGDSITVDSIMYIDQTSADNNGNFDFSNYVPMVNLVDGKKYTVKIGSTSLSAPISGGYAALPGTGADTYFVKGTVAYNGGGKVTKGSVKLLSGTDVLKSLEIDPTVCSYEFSGVENGTYTLRFDKPLHLPRTKEITVNGSGVTAPDVILPAGDLNGDNTINLSDLNVVINYFGMDPSTLSAEQAKADINEDQNINLLDINKIINDFGLYFE